MRLMPLGLVAVLLAASFPAAANTIAFDDATSAVVERRWPGALEQIERRLGENLPDTQKDQEPVEEALRCAGVFAAAESAGDPEETRSGAVRGFRGALDRLGPTRARFLGSSGGLGEIARTVLGDADFLALLDELKTKGQEPSDDQELRQASVRALETFYKSRFEEPRSAPTAVGITAAEGVRRRIKTTEPPRRTALDAALNAPEPDVTSAGAAPSSSLILELKEAALSALEAAARAVALPASALASAVDEFIAPIRRDMKLIAASQAAVEWLSGNEYPEARDLLQSFLQAAASPDAVRRESLVAALARTTALMTSAPEEGGDARTALTAALSDYVRFVREHLDDFRAGTRFSSMELGLPPNPESGAITVDYEITADGRLVPVRLTAADGSIRERGAAFGTWTIIDKTGRTTGWSLDAGSFAALPDAVQRKDAAAAAARWLTSQGFKPGGRGGMADELASLLQDALSRPETGIRSLQIYADRESGLVHLDSAYEHGLKQRVARPEPIGKNGEETLALFERTAADPNDGSSPWRETLAYRGGGERELMTAKVVSNGDASRRIVAGTTVESIPIAVHYVRGSDGHWERDGRTREFPEQMRLVHSSAGLVGGAGEVLSAAGRGATDLTGAVVAASMALDLTAGNALLKSGDAAEFQDDFFARAKANFADNAFLSAAGNYYAPDAYRKFKNALDVDDGKYIQNVRKELTDQGHPLLGALTAAGVDAADGAIPMAAGLGAIGVVSPLGLAGQAAATGVNIFWTGQAAWSAGISVADFVRARRSYDENDSRSVAEYYASVEGLAAQSVAAPMLAAGLHDALNEPARSESVDDRRFASEEALGPNRIDLAKASIREIGSQAISSRPELLSDLPLRKLYVYSIERRDFIAARVRAISQECGLPQAPDVVSLIKGQEPSGTEPGMFEPFRDGVSEKIRRKGYRTLNKMTDMARGRVSLEDFEAVKKFTLQAAKTESIVDISYPKGTSEEFVVELKRLLGDARVKEHKAANANNARIHIDLLDPKTDFIYELQVGTKYFNDLMQEPLVRVPQPLVRIFARLDPHGISGDRANFHLVYYDGVKALVVKHPEIADLPETRRFIEDVSVASRDSGGAAGMKPVDVAALTQSAEHLLDALYRRDPKIFDDLGHGG